MTKIIDPTKLDRRKRGRAKRLQAQSEMRKIAALAKVEDELIEKERAAVVAIEEEAPTTSAEGLENILYALGAAFLIGFLFAAGANGGIFYRLFAGVGGLLLGGIAMFIFVNNTGYTSSSSSPRLTFGIRQPLALLLTASSLFPATMIVGRGEGESTGPWMFAAPSLVFLGLGLFILWRRYDQAKDLYAWHVAQRDGSRKRKVADVTAAQARRLKSEVENAPEAMPVSAGHNNRTHESTKANGRLS